MDAAPWAGVGEAADGYMGVMPYRYYDDEEGGEMLDYIRSVRPEYQPTGYIQGFLTAMLFLEAADRVLEAGQELTADNLKAALNTIEDFDTGGLIGTPISLPGNSIPVGRVYQYDASAQRMEPVSDWINLQE